MANIEQELLAFKNAKKGEDVRDSMISAIRKINTVNEEGVEEIEQKSDQMVEIVDSQIQIDEEPTQYTKLKLETTGTDIEVLTAEELDEYLPETETIGDLKNALKTEAEALGSIQYLAEGNTALNNLTLVSSGGNITVNGFDYSNFIVLLTDEIKKVTYTTIDEQEKPIHLKAGHTYEIYIDANSGAYTPNDSVKFVLASANVSSVKNMFFSCPCVTGRYTLNVYSDIDVCALLFVRYETAVSNLVMHAHIVDTLKYDVAKNTEELEALRNLYYTETIEITAQKVSTVIPFEMHNGETFKFTNNTSGAVAVHLLDANNNETTVSTGITAGGSIIYTATTEFVQMKYWAQQLGTLFIERTNSAMYELSESVQKSNIASVGMFESIGAIGDSYTAGSTRNSAGTWKDYRNLSWIATMGKRSGTDWKNYGHGGKTTKSYLETTEFAQALNDTACNLYFFALGQNDGNQSLTIGTVADIHDDDYTQNADTFYGNYGRIIQQIKNHAPNAKLVMITNWVQGNTWTDYDVAIRSIASHYGIPVIEPFDDYFFNSALYQNYKEYGHPTAMGYSSMGIAMERLFSKCVIDNPLYFKFSTIG